MKEIPLTVVHAGSESCVRRVPIFRALDADEQDAVGSFARPVRLSRGELVHVAGDDAPRLFVVHTGRVKLVHATASGRERLLRVAEVGDVVGEHAFLTGEPPDYYAEADRDTQLCVFDHADLARLVAEYPGIALEMLRSLSARLTESQRLLGLETADVGARLAAYLLRLPEEAPRGARSAEPGPGARRVGEPAEGARRAAEPAEGARRVRLPLAKKDIASYLGTTPESLSRSLARLQSSGAIQVEGDVVELLDVEALEELAEGA